MIITIIVIMMNVMVTDVIRVMMMVTLYMEMTILTEKMIV